MPCTAFAEIARLEAETIARKEPAIAEHYAHLWPSVLWDEPGDDPTEILVVGRRALLARRCYQPDDARMVEALKPSLEGVR